jgi:hypothetical protein
MTFDEPPLVGEKWPHLAAELSAALREEGENDLPMVPVIETSA